MRGALSPRRWVWIVLVCFVLFMLSTSSGRGGPWNPLQELVIETVAPVQKWIILSLRATENFWLNYFHLVNVRKRNAELEREVATLHRENMRYRELLAASQRLERLEAFQEALDPPTVIAQVVGWDPGGWFRSVLIDRGETAGIRPGMPVLSADGVVGRVVAVSAHYAKVLLLVDQNSALDVLDHRSRSRGILKGKAENLCEMDYVLKSADIRPGDQLITSGLGGIFPKGLPVGQVLEVVPRPDELFQEVLVRPWVDFSRLEEVQVLLKEEGPSWGQEEES